MLELDYRSDIWQVPQQHCCWGPCQISEWYNNFNIQSCGLATLWDLVVRLLYQLVTQALMWVVWPSCGLAEFPGDFYQDLWPIIGRPQRGHVFRLGNVQGHKGDWLSSALSFLDKKNVFLFYTESAVVPRRINKINMFLGHGWVITHQTILLEVIIHPCLYTCFIQAIGK